MSSHRSILRSFAALTMTASLASCQKEENSAPVTELTLRDELTFSIAPSSQTELDLTTTYDARASVSELLREKGFSPSQLRDVRIEDARAVMIEPVNAAFTNIDAVQLHFTQVAGAPTPFAHLDPAPKGIPILELDVDHADLTSFFNDGPQTVHARLKTNGRLGNDTARVRFALKFRVKAGE